MKLEATETQTNCNLDTKNFTIRSSAIAFDILSSKLYSDPLMAVVRELLTNAYDSQVKNGNPDTPIDIVVPTWKDQVYSVRDYGTGLSKEDVMELYTTFFASTKSGDNEATGCFGLGSKTPFAFTNAFKVTSWYQGTKYLFACVKKNGYPSIIALSEEVSDEPSGMKVEVPFAGNSGEIVNKLRKYLSYIPEIRVRFMGGRVDGFPEVLIALTKCVIYERKNPYQKAAYVKQGQNVYEMPDGFIGDKTYLNRAWNEYTPVFEVPIGTLDITPNREQLSKSEKNGVTLMDVVEETEKELQWTITHDDEYGYRDMKCFADLYAEKANKQFCGGDKVIEKFHYDRIELYRDAFEATPCSIVSDKNWVMHFGSFKFGETYTVIEGTPVDEKRIIDKVRKYMRQLGLNSNRLIFIPDHNSASGNFWKRDKTAALDYRSKKECIKQTINALMGYGFGKEPMNISFQFTHFDKWMADIKERCREHRVSYEPTGRIRSYVGSFICQGDNLSDCNYSSSFMDYAENIKANNSPSDTLVYTFDKDESVDRTKLYAIAVMTAVKDLDGQFFLRDYLHEKYGVTYGGDYTSDPWVKFLGVGKGNLKAFSNYHVVNLSEILTFCLTKNWRVTYNFPHAMDNPYKVESGVRRCFSEKQQKAFFESYMWRRYKLVYHLLDRYNYFTVGIRHNMHSVLENYFMGVLGDKCRKLIWDKFPVWITNWKFQDFCTAMSGTSYRPEKDKKNPYIILHKPTFILQLTKRDRRCFTFQTTNS